MILKFGFELDWMRFWSSVIICDFGGLIWVVSHGGSCMWLVGAVVVFFFFFHCGLWWWVDVAGGGDDGFLLVMAWVVSLCWLWYGCWLVMLRNVRLRKRER